MIYNIFFYQRQGITSFSIFISYVKVCLNLTKNWKTLSDFWGFIGYPDTKSRVNNEFLSFYHVFGFLINFFIKSESDNTQVAAFIGSNHMFKSDMKTLLKNKTV